MRRLVVGLALALVPLASDEPRGGDGRTEVTGLEGAWQVKSVRAEGLDLPAEEFKGFVLTFRGTQVTYTNGDQRETGTYRLNASRSPMELDIVPTNRQPPVVRMIFRIDGDVLKIATTREETTRPRSFDDPGI